LISAALHGNWMSFSRPAVQFVEACQCKRTRDLCTSEQTCAAIASMIVLLQKDCFVGQSIPGAEPSVFTSARDFERQLSQAVTGAVRETWTEVSLRTDRKKQRQCLSFKF
jgi:hypothetical protein